MHPDKDSRLEDSERCITTTASLGVKTEEVKHKEEERDNVSSSEGIINSSPSNLRKNNEMEREQEKDRALRSNYIERGQASKAPAPPEVSEVANTTPLRKKKGEEGPKAHRVANTTSLRNKRAEGEEVKISSKSGGQRGSPQYNREFSPRDTQRPSDHIYNQEKMSQTIVSRTRSKPKQRIGIIPSDKAPEEVKTIYLKECNLMWFDKLINTADTEHHHPKLEKLFAGSSYVNHSGLLKVELEEADCPIVFFIKAKQYFENNYRIATLVSKSKWVQMVIIICRDMPKQAILLKDHPKIKCITEETETMNKFFKKDCQILHKNIVKGVSFNAKLFHQLSEQESIMESVCVKSMFFENESNFGFPLYYGGYKFSKNNWGKCQEVFGIRSEDQEATSIYGTEAAHILWDHINSILSEILSEDNTQLDGLLNGMLNTANKRGKDYFKLCSFALRGFVCMKGVPLTDTSISKRIQPLYSVINLNEEQLDELNGSVDTIMLLPMYLTTNTNIRHTKINARLSKTTYLLEITLTDQVSQITQFENSLDKLKDLWNGIFYPVQMNIMKKEGEADVLFPPYYPVKMMGVENMPDGFTIIKLIAPIYCNYGTNYKKDAKSRKEGLKNKYVDQYIKKIFELMGLRMLTQLDLSGGLLLQFEDIETQFIFNECEQSQTLLSLNLEDTNIHIPDYQGMVRPNESLIRLSLKQNKISHNEAKALGNYLSHWPKLKELDLSDNQIGDSGAIHLAKNLKNIPELTKFYLKNNKIRGIGTQAIALQIQQIPLLKELDLSVNEMGNTGAGILAQYLEYIPFLEKIWLVENDLDDAAVKGLSEFLRYKKDYLQDIYLGDNSFGPLGVEYFLNSLKAWPNLRNLDLGLGYRFIKEGGRLSRCENPAICACSYQTDEHDGIGEDLGIIMNKRVEYHLSKLVTDKIDVKIEDFVFEESEKPKEFKPEIVQIVADYHSYVTELKQEEEDLMIEDIDGEMFQRKARKDPYEYISNSLNGKYYEKFLEMYRPPSGTYPHNILEQLKIHCTKLEMEYAEYIFKVSPIIDCFRFYTSECGFSKKLNRSLALTDFGAFDELIKTILYHEKEIKSSLSSTIVWRGLALPKSVIEEELYKKGGEYYWTHFISTSTREDRAQTFMMQHILGGGIAVLFKIHLREDILYNKYNIREFSCHKTEEEILLMPYFRFRITECDLILDPHTEQPKLVIVAEELFTAFYGHGPELKKLLNPTLSLLWLENSFDDPLNVQFLKKMHDKFSDKLEGRIYTYTEEEKAKKHLYSQQETSFIVLTNGQNREGFIRDISLYGNISMILVFTSRERIQNIMMLKRAKNLLKLKGVYCKFGDIVSVINKFIKNYMDLIEPPRPWTCAVFQSLH